MNFFFKGYLNVRTGLKLFIEQFEKAIAEKVEQERKLNIDSSDVNVEILFHTCYLLKKILKSDKSILNNKSICKRKKAVFIFRI